MNKLLSYILIYCVIYFIGCLSMLVIENYYSTFISKKPPLGCSLKILLINGSFGGVSLVLVTLMLSWIKKKEYKRNIKINILLIIFFIILIFLLLVVYECTAGMISFKWHNKQTWNYNHNQFPMNKTLCNGYVSYINTFMFTILLIIWSLIIYKFL
jgi:hypothetical protein